MLITAAPGYPWFTRICAVRQWVHCGYCSIRKTRLTVCISVILPTVPPSTQVTNGVQCLNHRSHKPLSPSLTPSPHIPRSIQGIAPGHLAGFVAVGELVHAGGLAAFLAVVLVGEAVLAARPDTLAVARTLNEGEVQGRD